MKRGEQSNGLPPDGKSGGDSEPRPSHDPDVGLGLDLDAAAELKVIDAAVQGDIQAFSDLFERYRSDLHGFCLRRLNDHSLAEDVVQDTFLRAVKNLASFDRSKRVWPWLATIARGMCVDLQRHRSFTHYSGDIGASVDAGEYGRQSRDFLDEAMTSEEHVRLRSALDVLPERQRRAFLLHTLDGWSYKDIASAEGISVGAVGPLISRARKKMRSAYQNGSLPAIVFPITWLRWKLQRLEERIRPLLGVYGEGWSSVCMQAACLGTVAAIAVAMSYPVESSEVSNSIPPDKAVLSATGPLSMQPGGLQAALRKPDVVVPVNGKSSVDYQQYVAKTAESLADNLINPNQNATPENSSLYSIAASPNYEDDHTIVAAGHYGMNHVLFFSHDGGANWKPQVSRAYLGWQHTMALSPGYSQTQDRRIFTLGELGLLQSDDGGEIFRTVGHLWATSFGISPSLGERGFRILVGAKILFEYDAALGVTRPASLAIAPSWNGSSYSSVTFSPSYMFDSTVFVSDRYGKGDPGNSQFDQSILYRCKASVCDETEFPFPGPLTFRMSPRFNQDGLAYLFANFPGNKFLVTHDGGLTFREIPLAIGGNIGDVAVLWDTTPDPAIFVAAGDIYRSLDAGRSWNRTKINIPGFTGTYTLIATTTGRLLAVGKGIACSEDRGQTWTRPCAPE